LLGNLGRAGNDFAQARSERPVHDHPERSAAEFGLSDQHHRFAEIRIQQLGFRDQKHAVGERGVGSMGNNRRLHQQRGSQRAENQEHDAAHHAGKRRRA